MAKNKTTKLKSDQKEYCKEGIKQHTYRLLMASQSYDKAILGLSTATLGYTFVFAKFIIGQPHRGGCLLSITWFFLFLSILFVLISFVFEQRHAEHRIKYFYWCLTRKSESTADKKQKHWSDDEWMILPILSGGCFFVSIVLFAIFVGANIF